MQVAVCGYLPRFAQIKSHFDNIECKFFIKEFTIVHQPDEKYIVNVPPISFFEFRRLIASEMLDGLIIANEDRNIFTKQLIRTFKLYQIPNVGFFLRKEFIGLTTPKFFCRTLKRI